MSAELAVRAARRRDEASRDLVHAWHVATLGIAAYVGKLPELSTLLNRMNQGQRRNAAEIRLEAALIAERIGVPVRPMSEEAKAALMRLSKES